MGETSIQEKYAIEASIPKHLNPEECPSSNGGIASLSLSREHGPLVIGNWEVFGI
jgi:hypothetical protein